MRVVLDTNVFVSGIFWEGNFCSQIIDKWKKGSFELVISMKIIEELVKTLKSFKIQMDDELIEEWNNLIIENSVVVEPPMEIDAIKEDPEDNKFIEAAIFGKAEYIISQDKHMLKLKEYRRIKIIEPEEAARIL